MKHWRPQGWENPYSKRVSESLGIPEGERKFLGFLEVLDTSAVRNSYNEGCSVIFEAGADAMLEALTNTGTWVFIPDEEK